MFVIIVLGNFVWYLSRNLCVCLCFRCGWIRIDPAPLFFYRPDQPVGKPGRFREAITSGAGQDQLFRAPQVHFMADTDKDRFDIGSGADNTADALIFSKQWTDRAPGQSRFLELADKSAFGAANGWQAGEHADMAGDSETARMGDALTITEQDIRNTFQLAQGGDQGRGLTEGKQAWDIGKGQGAGGGLLFEDLLFLYIPQHNAADTESVVRSKGGIDSGYQR